MKMQRLVQPGTLGWLLGGSVRFFRVSPKCHPISKRRKFIDPVVVSKTPSKKKSVEIYEDMKIG